MESHLNSFAILFYQQTFWEKTKSDTFSRHVYLLSWTQISLNVVHLTKEMTETKKKRKGKVSP